MSFSRRLNRAEKYLDDQSAAFEREQAAQPVDDPADCPSRDICLPDNGRMLSGPLKKIRETRVGNVVLRIYPAGQCPENPHDDPADWWKRSGTRKPNS